MVPYIIVFIIVICLTYISEKSFTKEKKKIGTLCVFLSILIMSILAAVRNADIGKDINTYVIPSFNWAINLEFNEFIKVGNLELGYMIFTFILGNIFQDYHFILLFIQIIISILVYIIAYKVRKKVPMTLFIITYLLLVYNDTFTMMRQSISVFLITLSYITIKDKKYVKTVILFIIAILFHFTAIIALLGYMIIMINSENNISNNKKKTINMVMILIFVIFVVFYKDILYFCTYNISIVPTKFYTYINYERDFYISKSHLIFKIVCFLISLMYTNIIKKYKMSKVISIFLFIDLVIYIMSFNLAPIMRLGYYFSYPALLYIIPKIPEMFKKNIYNQIIVHISILLFLISFWYFNHVIHNESGNTYPYKSDIINELLK